MGARLFIHTVDGREVREELAYPFDQLRVVLGRSAAADIRLPHRTVSERHASLEQNAGTYRLTDTGSTNGTRVNGQALVPHRGRRLQHGDQIDLGVYTLVFHDSILVTEPLTADRSAELARRLLQEQGAQRSATGITPRLVVVTGPQSGASLDFSRAAGPDGLLAKIGSTTAADLTLEGEDIAEEHLHCVRSPEGIRLQGQGTPPHAFTVGGHSHSEWLLQDGDEVCLGDVTLLFEEPSETVLHQLDDDQDLPYTYQAAATAPPPSKPTHSQPPKTPTRRANRTTASMTPMARTGTDKPAPVGPRQSHPTTAADLLVFGLAGVMLTISIAALVFLLR